MAPGKLGSRKDAKLLRVDEDRELGELLKEPLEEVASLDNELYVFITYSFLLWYAWNKDTWPALAHGLPECKELIVSSCCLKAFEGVLSSNHICHVLIPNEARLHNLIVTVVAQISIMGYPVFIRCVLNYLSELGT
jgi:hypothetical protein